MLATEPRAHITPTHVREPSTGVDADAPATRNHRRNSETRAAWQEVIDRMLMDWLCDPSQFCDEGIDVPSGMIIRRSIALAENFRDMGLPPPDSVVPDPNGGIVFERREGQISEVFHIWDDGTVEYMRFDGSRLVERSMP